MRRATDGTAPELLSATQLRGLEVVLQNIDGLAVGITPVLDDHAAAADNLAGIALLVDLAEAGPFAELLAILNLNIKMSWVSTTWP